MGQFRHHHSGKTRTMALFWLCASYHAQRYMFQRYMLRSLPTQSFNIVNTPIILLFPKGGSQVLLQRTLQGTVIFQDQNR